MNIKGLVSALSACMVIGGCSSEPYQPYAYSQNILGPWDCNNTFEENDTSLKMSSTDTYLRNGASNSFGIMKVKFTSEMPEVEYSVAATAEWKIQGKYLVQTITDVKIVNLSHPEIDDVLKLQDLFPTNISESSEILKLTPTEIVLDSESGAGLYRCTKRSA